MSKDSLVRRYSRRTLLVVGCTVGALVGATLGILVQIEPISLGAENRSFLDFPSSAIPTDNVATGFFDSNVGHTLLVLQSIGILLPLFTGLLRFTTDDKTEVGERVNDYLVIGILGLVLGGVFATIGGFTADMAVILKVSLFPVLIAFTVIGFAAIGMLRGMADSMNESDDSRTEVTTSSGAETGDEPETNPSTATGTGEADEREVNQGDYKTQAETSSKTSARETKQPKAEVESVESTSSESTKIGNE